MNDDLIVSDQPLIEGQKAILAAILDTLIPASDDGALPSAGVMDFVGYMSDRAPGDWSVIVEVLDHFDDVFASQDLAHRFDRLQTFSLAEPGLFGDVLRQVYGCYYMQASVLAVIGSGAGAPYPRGNTVEDGDLSLLDPVMSSTISWRRT